jgi:antitoxin ParD1/3/4
MMNINFPPVDEEYIRRKIEAGFYSNATELVRDAIRRLREVEEKEKLERFRAAVMLGHQQAVRGETTEYSPELVQDLVQQAFDNKNRGKPVKNDIK